MKKLMLTIVMLVGNLLIRVAVAGIIAIALWLPCFCLLDFTTRSLDLIFCVCLVMLLGLWECCDMTGLKEKIEHLDTSIEE